MTSFVTVVCVEIVFCCVVFGLIRYGISFYFRQKENYLKRMTQLECENTNEEEK